MFTTTLRRDVPAQFFAACAVLTLTVSIPATFALLRPFHDAGGWIGVAFAVFAMLVLEIGAVGAKLISVVIPRWWWHLTALTVALLVLTTLGNYLHGVELFRAAQLPPTLAAIRNDTTGAWLAPLLAAALFPLLLFVWLTALTERLKMIGGDNTHVASLQAELTEARQVIVRLTQQLDAVDILPLSLTQVNVNVSTEEVDDRRQRVKYLVDSGQSVTSAARDVGVSRQTATKWLKG